LMGLVRVPTRPRWIVLFILVVCISVGVAGWVGLWVCLFFWVSLDG